MSRSSDGTKPLSGKSYASGGSQEIQDAIITTITSGTGGVFNNITITGGTIDGVTIGENLPGPAYFISLQVGNPDGTGGPVCFFGNTPGDFACWRNATGEWDIGGDLKVRDNSLLGNILVSSNTISNEINNSNLNIETSGTGIVNITGGGLTSSVSGNINLNAVSGSYASSSKTYSVSTQLNHTTTTSNGSINLNTGASVVSYNISEITTDASPVITTTLPHNLIPGDRVILSGTNSTPTINSVYVVQAIPSTTAFTISTSPPLTVAGDTGTVTKRNDINLNPLDSVFVTVDTPVSFGSDTVSLSGDTSSNLNVTAGNDINLNPVNNINIPTDKLLTFSDDLKNITSDGTDLIVNSNTRVVINGDLTVNGDTTYIKTTVTALDDPVITLGGTTSPLISDIKDRGVEVRYYDGTGKIGFFGKKTDTGCFTWIPDATNTNEVFTGSPGCAQFGSTSVTSLNVNGGSLTNVGTLNTCNISCPGDLVISGGTSVTVTTQQLTLNSTHTSITDSLIEIGTTGISDTADKGFVYNYYDGSPKKGFLGWDSNTDCFKFLKDVTVVGNEITAGTNADLCLGNVSIENLLVSGNLTEVVTPERFSVAGGDSQSPESAIGITFITVTSAGIATGTLGGGLADGFEKKIFLVSAVPGGVYHLSCPVGRLVDPGSGTSAVKTLKFEYPGQSIHLAWDNVVQSYFIVNAGVCIE